MTEQPALNEARFLVNIGRVPRKGPPTALLHCQLERESGLPRVLIRPEALNRDTRLSRNSPRRINRVGMCTSTPSVSAFVGIRS